MPPCFRGTRPFAGFQDACVAAGPPVRQRDGRVRANMEVVVVEPVLPRVDQLELLNPVKALRVGVAAIQACRHRRPISDPHMRRSRAAELLRDVNQPQLFLEDGHSCTLPH